MNLLDIIAYLKDPNRTQQVQGLGGLLEDTLSNMQRKSQYATNVMEKALPDPSNLGEVGDRGAYKEAANMAFDALSFAPAGMTKTQSLLDRETIRQSADNLAQQLNDLGFKADVTHSGSRAGPSSYVNISDPQTGRFFTKQVRFSNHGKGPKEAQGVIDIQDITKDTKNIIDTALEMRSAGKSKVILMEEKADELIAQGMKPKRAYAEAKKLFY